MNHRKQLPLISIPIVLALVASMIMVSPAYADDATPPPVDTPTEPAPPSSAAPTDSAPDSSEPAAADLLAELPENTDVVVLDDSSESVPLASAEAAEIISSGDPIWCPTGHAPNPGVGGCSPAKTSLSNFVATFVPTGSGTIWIQNVADTGVEATMDGAGSWATAKTFSLTLQGGWNGVSGSTTISGSSTFDTAINIAAWEGNVTIKNLFMSTVPANAAEPGSGALYVATTRNIIVANVSAFSTSGGGLDGLYLDNSLSTMGGTVTVTSGVFANNNSRGVTILTTGAVTLTDTTSSINAGGEGVFINNGSYDAVASAVTITNGVFTGNANAGASISSNGSVTLKDVLSSNNAAMGVEISSLAGAGNVTLSNTNTFNSNTFAGLYIATNGTVTAKHLIADYNGTDGVHIDNIAGGLIKAVTLSGSGEFKGNIAGDGMVVTTNGVVTLNNLNAVSNFGAGVYVTNNTLGTTTSAVYIKGSNNFNSNGSYGLSVTSQGLISVSNVTANYNAGIGVRLDNDAPPAPTTPNVMVTGFLTATYNTGRGLSIFSDGTVTATNLTIRANTQEGAYIDNDGTLTPKAVTISGTNIFDNNFHEGLQILSLGAVTLNNITAIWNGIAGSSDVAGVAIDNQVDPAVQQNVTLNGTNSFINNARGGLEISSYGAVTLSNLTAATNGTLFMDAVGTGVFVDNFGGNAAKTVTLKGASVFYDNDGNGLQVYSKGAVSASNLTSTENGSDGVHLDNQGPFASAVSIGGVNNFSQNGDDGLEIVSHGAIKVSSTTANQNFGDGVFLQSFTAASTQGVSITGYVTANENGSGGLKVYSLGTITATNLQTSHNVDQGTYLTNDFTTPTPKAVTIGGSNVFTDNGDEGLRISSRGAITLNNLTADWNGSATDAPGVWVSNDYVTTSQQNVTVNGSNMFSNNGSHGLRINSYGIVTLNNITSLLNGDFLIDTVGSGLYLYNKGGTLAKPVTLKGTNIFNENDAYGLLVQSDGIITVYNLTAYHNDQDGARLDNSNLAVQSKVSILGYGSFEWNGGQGLHIASNGAISLTYINSRDNTSEGANLFTQGLTGPQSVTLSGNNTLVGNSTTGLLVNADGSITVNNVEASGNGFNGATLDNYTNWNAGPPFATFGSVTITGFGHFESNLTSDGLYINTHGSATLNHVSSDNNGNGVNDSGMWIDADGNVTLVCSGTYGNQDNGLLVLTPGTLTLKGFSSYQNADDEDFTAGGGTVRLPCP